MGIEETTAKTEGLILNFLETLPEKALHLGIRVVLAIVFFLIGVQIVKLLRKILRKSMQRAGAEVGAVQFVDSFLKTSLYVVMIFLLATSFGVDAASIVALLGSAGVAIGLAIQGSLSNLAGGVLILMLKPFKVGDYIHENTDHQEGTVTEIQIFYTKLVTGDNKVIVLPNGTLANNSIVNMSAAKTRRMDIVIGISYDSDIKKAKEALMEVLENDPFVLKEQEMCVYVSELAASAINLGVRCFFSNQDFWEGKWRITENCKYALDRAGIEIPYPQLDVHMKREG